jgi:hypothetical protein
MGESGTGGSVVAETTRLLCVAALGVFAGAMVTESYILVPYWRSLPASDFFAWYAANDRRLYGFFAPVTAVAALLAIASAAVSFWDRHPRRSLTLLAAVLSFAALSTYFIYFQHVNPRFATAGFAADELGEELTRWALWHRWRTGMSFAALAAGVLCLWPAGRHRG